MPKCIGGSTESECLCFGAQCCCNPSATPFPIGCVEKKEGQICVCGLYCLKYYLQTPTALCKGAGQMCCAVQECAIPCTPDIPVMCVVYGIACSPKFGFCLKYGELSEKK